MATFALHPPLGVDVVSFFVTARLAGHSDSVAFTDALIEQLSAIVGEAIPQTMPAASRDAYRRMLLASAARRTRQTGRRLVLLVDGLDEDAGTAPGSGVASIASLLPRRPEDGLKVIVSGRPDPPVPADVPDDHPLRAAGCIRVLAPSPHAVAAARHAGAELAALLTRDPFTRDLVGLIASAERGLSSEEICALTGQPPFVLEQLLNAAAGRTFRRHDGSRIVFAHETLAAVARTRLGESLLQHYRGRLREGAKGI